jgi:hypothetical protein
MIWDMVFLYLPLSSKFMGSNAITNGSSKRNNVDETKLKDFMGKVLNDLGGAWSTALVVIGDNTQGSK